MRLQFELNLEDWHVPEHLLAGMRDAHEEFGEESGKRIEFHDPAEFVRSGWVALVVKWNRFRGRPVLASYEVGVNESLFGRIEAGDYEQLEMAFNDAHPLFETLDAVPTAAVHAAGVHEREAAEGLQLVQVDVRARRTSPLPDWDEGLSLEGEALDDRGYGGPGYGRFAALVLLPARWPRGHPAAQGWRLSDMSVRCASCVPIMKSSPGFPVPGTGATDRRPGIGFGEMIPTRVPETFSRR